MDPTSAFGFRRRFNQELKLSAFNNYFYQQVVKFITSFSKGKPISDKDVAVLRRIAEKQATDSNAFGVHEYKTKSGFHLVHYQLNHCNQFGQTIYAYEMKANRRNIVYSLREIPITVVDHAVHRVFSREFHQSDLPDLQPDDYYVPVIMSHFFGAISTDGSVAIPFRSGLLLGSLEDALPYLSGFTHEFGLSRSFGVINKVNASPLFGEILSSNPKIQETFGPMQQEGLPRVIFKTFIDRDMLSEGQDFIREQMIGILRDYEDVFRTAVDAYMFFSNIEMPTKTGSALIRRIRTLGETEEWKRCMTLPKSSR